jgi:hypothetical protein
MVLSSKWNCCPSNLAFLFPLHQVQKSAAPIPLGDKEGKDGLLEYKLYYFI